MTDTAQLQDTQKLYFEASIKTADNLKTIAQSAALRELSTLSLPEIEKVINLVARITPAGNVPGMILNGLARLPGRKPPLKTLKRDINLLFRGMEQSLDKAVYAAVFAGPAAVIWGYQNLLKLAGKDPSDSFPEGMWQFYVDYALREDTARHATETHGFDSLLKQFQINLSPIDRATAWVMAAIHSLHQYNYLLQNEWRERVYTYILQEVTANEPNAAYYAQLYPTWEKQRPYIRSNEAIYQSYADYRQVQFDQFLETAMRDLSPALQQAWFKKAEQAKAEALPAYQKQMSILAYLNPDEYGESRVEISLAEAKIGLIYQGHYHLIPACLPDSEQPNELEIVRAQIATLMSHVALTRPTDLTMLAKVRRAAWPTLRQVLEANLLQELDKLQTVPIMLNCGPTSRQLPLAEIRQAERGIGHHALTMFDTGETMVFDQSHIFFDGAWGASLAEILTNEALSWAVYLHSLPPAEAADTPPASLTFPAYDIRQQVPLVTTEAAAETEGVNLGQILQLRKRFKQRNDLLNLTVNDLLVLYRAIHAATYQPDADLVTALKRLTLTETTQQAAQAAWEGLEKAGHFNPAIVLPVDASRSNPQARLYPMTFEVPLADLDLLTLHEHTLAAHRAYTGSSGDRTAAYHEFDKLQRQYLATLAGFGAVLSKAKLIALAGESASMGSIKLLAYMPIPLQRMLDAIPSRFEVLNDLIKGQEVISNVGVVAPTSTLTRFITAKDDNDKKTLAWGIITDAEGVMRLTLRDFRPHVALLQSVGQRDMAKRIAQDYLDSYVSGLNHYVQDLLQITETSRETQLKSEK